MIRMIHFSLAAFALSVSACERHPPTPKAKPDTGRTIQVGKASFYSEKFAGQKTATGERLKLNDMTAASRTLPLGAHVQVINKDTGQAANVRINDRGPYVDDRVIDLTPKAARHIGLDRSDGVATVAVKTIASNTTSD